jgi:hypothetical protein
MRMYAASSARRSCCTLGPSTSGSHRSAVAWTLFACACERDDATRYELDGLTVIQEFDEPICAGSFDYFERRLRWLEQETGLPRDPQGLSYRWLFDRAAVEAACNLSLGGCTKGRVMFGDLIVFSHELVHAHLSMLTCPGSAARGPG